MQIYVISKDQASEAMRLIQEYLTQGGIGFDYEKLEAVAEALCNADEIEIGDSEDDV